MQLLATVGYEVEKTSGLNFIEGEIELMQGNFEFRIPHVGWNDIKLINNGNQIVKGVHSETDFYFVHSYCFNVLNKNNIVAETIHGDKFTSIVAKNNIYGTQFHPEKSGKAGFVILKNFLAIL